MHITHLTGENPYDPDAWSGTTYWISKSMETECSQFKNLYFTESQMLLSPVEEMFFRCKQLWAQYSNQTHLVSDFYAPRARHIAAIAHNYFQHQKTDVILASNGPLPIAYLETRTPIVYWTDAVYAAMVGYYPKYRFHHSSTMWDAYELTNACLLKASLLIFSSQWAARSAIELHGISTDKIKIIPFGANLEITHTLYDVKNMIKARSTNCIKLLFVGKNWYRKGGDITLKVAEALHSAGHAVELTIVGDSPADVTLPAFVKKIDFISKQNKAGIETLFRLYQEAHFLFVPSRAEAFGIVFCEANAFGVPCISTHTGGIPDVIKNGINGMTFSLEASIKEYCDYITNVIADQTAYEALALSAFNEYQTRLNWKFAAGEVKKYITDIL